MTAPRCSDRAAAELAARQAIRSPEPTTRRVIRADQLRRGDQIRTSEGWATVLEVGHTGLEGEDIIIDTQRQVYVVADDTRVNVR